MAYFVRVIKAASLRLKLRKYEKEKTISKDEYLYGVTRKDHKTKKKTTSKKFQGTKLGRYFMRFKTKNTRENFCMKSFLGFFGGVLLTYVYLFFFVYGFRFPLQATTYVCGFFGVIFCMGLAFSRAIRCYVLLMIPVFFSKQGRRVLLSYALFLSFTGPLKNTLENVGVLSDSMNCGQDVIRRTMKQIEEMIKAPFRAMKETLAKIVKTLNEAIKKIKAFFDNIMRIIVGILRVIKKAVSWLGSIINICNKKLGTPFQRCMKTFNDAIEDCKAKLGVMDFLCHVVHVVKPLCYTVKFLDLICMFTDFISESIVGVVKKKLKDFRTMVKTMLYVSIEYSHSYDYSMEATNSTREIAESVYRKLLEKFEYLNKIFSMLGWAFTFLFIYIFFSVMYYKYKYMSSDRYDNRYITKYITELDLKRVVMNKETVLPLELRERKHFCRPTSLRLLREEQISILRAMLVLSLSTMEIASFIVCDYCLYWVLFTIYTEGHKEFVQVQSADVELQVKGKGSLAEFYKKLGKIMKIQNNMDVHLDPAQCLPDPLPPDKDRYVQIAVLTAICWVLTITEAYGLRLRGIVLSHYYPDRAKERAVWLYNHILRSRGTFLKFARRQLRRRITSGEGEKPIEQVTLKERILATVPFLEMLFGKKKGEGCLLCGTPGKEKEPLIKCNTPNCVGKFCLNCYATLNNICTVCQQPIEYGDLTDISEERDSSEEDQNEAKKVVFTAADSGAESDVERDKTFQDMEIRPKFRDLEKNKVTDYAQPSDFGPSQDEKEQEEESEHLKQFGKYVNTAQAYKFVQDKVNTFISHLKRQKIDKVQALKNRQKMVINALKKRLLERKLKNAEEIDDADKYEEALIRKGKLLTKKLKRSSEELLKRVESNKENFTDTAKRALIRKGKLLTKKLRKSSEGSLKRVGSNKENETDKTKEALVRKGKLLTKKLKKSSEELLKRVESNKENMAATESKETHSKSTETERKPLEEKRNIAANDIDVNFIFERERRQYAGVFPNNSDSLVSLRHYTSDEDDRKVVVKFSGQFPIRSQPHTTLYETTNYYVEQEVVSRKFENGAKRESARSSERSKPIKRKK